MVLYSTMRVFIVKGRSAGQSGLEYLVIFTVLMVALIPLISIASQRATDSATISTAQTAVNTFISAADSVFAQAPGSSSRTSIFLPQSYLGSSSSLNRSVVTMAFVLSNGAVYFATGNAQGNFSGKLPADSGYHVFTFYFNANGTVNVSTTTP